MTIQEQCKTDPFVLSRVLGYDFQEDVHRPLFETLLQFKGGTLRDLSSVKNRLVLWPRGHFKTSATVLHIVQLILNYPDVRILLMQGNLKLTKGWLAEIKSHFTGKNPKSLLPKLFPEFCAETLGNAFEFTTPARQRGHLKEATVTVASQKAISTGQHYDAAFFDDLVHQNNYRNIELLDKLAADVDLFMPLIDPGGYTTMTGTRYHHADLYGRVIRRNQGEWAVSVKGSSLTGKWPITDDNELLFPVRVVDNGTRKIGFTKELLEQLARDNPETFWAQYMNQIVSARTQIFPESLILGAVRSRTVEKDGRIEPNPEFPEMSPTVLALDLAEGKRADACHSVVAAGRLRGNSVWITDCVGSTFSTHELATVLINKTLQHRPVAILVENAVGATHFVTYVKSLALTHGIQLPIQMLQNSRHKDAKKIRIEALESYLKNRRLFFLAGIPDFQQLMDEFTQYPKGERVDRPDTIGMLVEWFGQGFTPLGNSRLPWVVTANPDGAPWDDLDAPKFDTMLGDVLVG